MHGFSLSLVVDADEMAADVRRALSAAQEDADAAAAALLLISADSAGWTSTGILALRAQLERIAADAAREAARIATVRGNWG